MVRRVQALPPTNVHWLDYRKEKKLPITNDSNFIKISPENLAKLKKQLKEVAK